jgi:hypothetical protein
LPVGYISPAIEENLNDQISHLARWLQKAAPHVADEQMHLLEDTEARAYWHYGYLTALRDLQRLLNDR